MSTNTSIADYAGKGTVFFCGCRGPVVWRDACPLYEVRCRSCFGWAVPASVQSGSLLATGNVSGRVCIQPTEVLTSGPEQGCLRVDRGTLAQVESIQRILASEGFRPSTAVVGIDSLCGWVYLVGGSSPGVRWLFRDHEQYLRQILKRCDVKVMNSSWIWIRSFSQAQELDRWWPSQTQSPTERRLAIFL